VVRLVDQSCLVCWQWCDHSKGHVFCHLVCFRYRCSRYVNDRIHFAVLCARVYCGFKRVTTFGSADRVCGDGVTVVNLSAYRSLSAYMPPCLRYRPRPVARRRDPKHRLVAADKLMHYCFTVHEKWDRQYKQANWTITNRICNLYTILANETALLEYWTHYLKLSGHLPLVKWWF